MAHRAALGLVAPAVLAALAGTAAAQVTPSDTCAGAPTIGVGTFTGSTTAATNDGQTSCGSSNSSRDVWYRFTATVSGIVTASTCTGTGFDTVMSLHSACPGTAANTLACSDDACGSGSRVSSTSLAAGASVLIRVGGFSTANGAYTLTVTFAEAPPPPPPPPPSTSGPDVTVGNIVDVGRFGTNTGGTITAYAVGTDACNRGDQPVSWYDTGPRNHEHPVIAQNMYRYKVVNGAGRFEQLGQSWLKHGFASTNSNACGTCQQPPDGGDQLGVNCSDTYGSGLNGGQTYLGPRSEVNVANASYLFPHGTGTGTDGTSGTVCGMRLQVPTPDVTGAANAGAQYWVDAHYVTMDDARWLRPNQTAAINALNNISYRKINIQNGTGTPTFLASTVQQRPGIFAWQEVDPLITLIPVDYPEPHPTNTAATITGRFWVGAKATHLPTGDWHYEYAIYNLNSDRSGGSFTIPLPASATLSNVEFHHPRSHSGEPYSNDPWTFDRASNSLAFHTSTFAVSSNANAIRWGTLYNVRFDTNAAPNLADAVIGLFKPAAAGFPDSVTVPNIPLPIVPPTCFADINGDGMVTPDDLADYITCYFSTPPCPLSDFDFSGAVTPDDLSSYIGAFFAGCN